MRAARSNLGSQFSLIKAETKEREDIAMTRKEIPIYDSLPEGWKIKENASTAPRGYVWIWNVKSHFGGEYRHGLMKIRKEGE